MPQDMSPEEKLLSLIKNKNKDNLIEEPRAAAREEKGEKITGASTSDTQIVKKARLFGSKFLSSGLFDESVLRTINKYLLIAGALLFVYFLAELLIIRPYRNIDSLVFRPEAKEEKKDQAAGAGAKAQDFSSYSKELSQKTVFGSTAGTGARGSGNISVSQDVSERIGLVGIVAGDEPEAIIEDKKSQKTYYLKVGQSFDEFLLEEISDGKVLVTSDGKKTTLTL